MVNGRDSQGSYNDNDEFLKTLLCFYFLDAAFSAGVDKSLMLTHSARKKQTCKTTRYHSESCRGIVFF
jgi:hypothetical protein